MVSPLFEQAAFRVRNDDGSETTATWRESENVNWETPPGYNMRVRFAINQTAATADATLGRTFRLRYSKNGGAYVNIGSTSATTEAIRAALSSNFSDAAPTTDQISGTGTFVAGQMDESGATGTIFSRPLRPARIPGRCAAAPPRTRAPADRSGDSGASGGRPGACVRASRRAAPD